ncbi:hypothetical protein B1218_36030, partial [Pseudomonas ogarae]
ELALRGDDQGARRGGQEVGAGERRKRIAGQQGEAAGQRVFGCRQKLNMMQSGGRQEGKVFAGKFIQGPGECGERQHAVGRLKTGCRKQVHWQKKRCGFRGQEEESGRGGTVEGVWTRLQHADGWSHSADVEVTYRRSGRGGCSARH